MLAIPSLLISAVAANSTFSVWRSVIKIANSVLAMLANSVLALQLPMQHFQSVEV